MAATTVKWRQKEKDKYHAISLQPEQILHKWTCVNRTMDTEDTLVVAKGEGPVEGWGRLADVSFIYRMDEQGPII